MVNDTMQGAPALRKILANKNKLDHGIRIAMEAGLWNLADAELGGLSGYQDALLYTAVGEGLAAGVSRVAGRYKNKNRTKLVKICCFISNNSITNGRLESSF